MTTCTACQKPIPERLYEFGDRDAPMCQSCYLGLLNELAAWPGLYTHEPIRDEQGRQVGHTTHLTEFGVVFFDGHGVPGELLATVYYGKGKQDGNT